DAKVHSLVNQITGSSVWDSGKNAIIVVWDENDSETGPSHIAAIVKTSYNTHSILDGTAYTHDSLLRTIEDGLLGGTSSLAYLNNAGHASAMTTLFAVSVPEPETYVMLLAGLGLIAVVARIAGRRAKDAIRNLILMTRPEKHHSAPGFLFFATELKYRDAKGRYRTYF
ncbi:MAG: PEP-CTERM sorting domain-containing protein, partial [Nitrosospira sp.]